MVGGVALSVRPSRTPTFRPVYDADRGCINVACVTSPQNPIRPPAAQASRSRHERSERLREARLYLCSDLQRFVEGRAAPDTIERLDTNRLAEFFRAVFRGGVDIVQVRDKKVSIRTELEALDVLVAVAREEGGLSAANDRADAALLAGVDVFHIGQTDLTTEQARRVVGDDVLIGRSCHSEDQVRAASADSGVDYYCTGPIWETPTKPGRPAVGLGLPAFAADLERDSGPEPTPFFAIGGVDEQTVPRVLEAGAERIVVVRAITASEDPGSAARRLRERLATQ